METEEILQTSSRGRLAALRRAVEGWRSGCVGPQGRMPERLWSEAVALAGELGVGRVASGLALSAAALDRRVRSGDARPRRPAQPVFLDLTPPFVAPEPLELTLVARDGTRLALRGSPGAIEALVHSVLERAP
jgi:hypothetical protein